LVALSIGALGLVLFLVVSGRWRSVRRLMWWQKTKARELEAAKLEARIEANKDRIAEEEGLRKKLDADLKKIEREHKIASLEVEGLDHDGIAAALKEAGF